MKENRKIGLLGLHYGPNYGTILQAYALVQAIKRQGYNCEYIRYSKKKSCHPFVQIVKKTVKQLLVRANLIKIKRDNEFYFFSTKDFRKIISKFDRFHKKYISCSSVQYDPTNISKANDMYDSFIVGSDQTWSEFMNNSGNGYLFFLPFVTDNAKKKSYAPSIGTLSISTDYINILRNDLSNFGFLSCRERQNCRVIETITGNKCEYVLDPTLLLTPADWNSISAPIVMPEQYILCYILGQKQCVVDFATNLGKVKNIPVYYILSTPFVANMENVIDDVGPCEFVSLIRNARYVITDSFHGTIFSINYNVNFYSFTKRQSGAGIGQDNDRISLILEEFGLENRFRSDNEMHISEDIDYACVNQKLEILRCQSVSYLETLLNI